MGLLELNLPCLACCWEKENLCHLKVSMTLLSDAVGCRKELKNVCLSRSIKVADEFHLAETFTRK